MFSICEKCGKQVKAGKDLCFQCAKGDRIDNIKIPDPADKYNQICSCGERGRIIKIDSGRKNKEGKPQYEEWVRCFYCYNAYKDKQFFSAADKWMPKLNQAERAYQMATIEYYLKPLFYNEKPNYEALALAHDKVLGIVPFKQQEA